jgi:hypothetical protein
MGAVGVAAGMGIIACIVCNVSRLRFHSSCYLTIIILDMRNRRRDDNFRSQIWITRMEKSLDPNLDAGIYSLGIASNHRASTFTMRASLAGLLWRDVLKKKGIHIHQWRFCKLKVVEEMYATRTRVFLSFL